MRSAESAQNVLEVLDIFQRDSPSPFQPVSHGVSVPRGWGVFSNTLTHQRDQPMGKGDQQSSVVNKENQGTKRLSEREQRLLNNVRH